MCPPTPKMCTLSGANTSHDRQSMFPSLSRLLTRGSTSKKQQQMARPLPCPDGPARRGSGQKRETNSKRYYKSGRCRILFSVRRDWEEGGFEPLIPCFLELIRETLCLVTFCPRTQQNQTEREQALNQQCFGQWRTHFTS